MKTGARLIGGLLCALARVISGARAHWAVVGPDPRQRVYFANHTSHLDAVVLWALLPVEVRELTRPAAAKDYWGKGRLRRYLATEVLKAILIERGRVSREENPLESILQGMGDRYSLIVFPEGTRNPGPEVGPFRSGLYHLARRRPDVELVPVYIDNMNRILPRGEYIPIPLLSRVTFGPALHLQEHESKASFLLRAREAVIVLRDL